MNSFDPQSSQIPEVPTLLNHEWIFWICEKRRDVGTTWTRGMVQVQTIRSIKDLGLTYESAYEVCQGKSHLSGTRSFIFRPEIKPAWEDEQNGGRWSIVVPCGTAQNGKESHVESRFQWLDLLVLMTGENPLDIKADLVNGAGISVYPQRAKLQLWFSKAATADDAALLGQQISKKLGLPPNGSLSLEFFDRWYGDKHRAAE